MTEEAYIDAIVLMETVDDIEDVTVSKHSMEVQWTIEGVEDEVIAFMEDNHWTYEGTHQMKHKTDRHGFPMHAASFVL